MSRPHLRLILLLLILAVLGPPGISTEKSVGCLFSERLCLEDEWCYDDLAFGRCLPATTDLDQDDLHRYALEREGLHQLNKELRRLFALGYRWSHGYTQCRLQTLLYAFKHDLEFEVNACSHLSDNDLEGALRALEGQVELEPEEVAIIKYTPSVEDPHASFADEVYYPPADVRAREELRQKILSPNAIPLDMPDPYADLVVKRAWYPPMKRDIAPFFDGRYGVAKYRRFDQEPSQDSLEFLQKYENEYPDGPLRLSSDPFLDISSQKTLQDAAEFLSQMQLTPEEINQIFTPENYRKLQKFIESYSDSDASLNSPSVKSLIQQKIAEMGNEVSDGENFDDNLQAMEQASEDQSRFPSTYNSPNTFRAGYEVKDEVIPDFDTDDKGHFLDDVRIYDEPEDQNTQDPTESGSGIGFFSEEKYNDILNPRDAIFRERQQKQDEENERFQRKWGKFQHPQVVYSEGGVDEPENGETQEELLNMDDDDFANIWRYNMGFKRPERLDVKKPGPPFDPLTLEEPQQNVRSLLKKSQREPKSPIKKNPRNPNPNSIDLSYARRYPEELYVKVSFRNLLKDWETGHNILQNISNLLHMDLKDFTDSQVNFYDITFRVNPANNRGYNETDVAKKIELIQGDLEKLSGATLESISVGTREKTQEVYFSRINTENRYIVLFLVCGVLVALILASAVLILIRRHIKIKEKLHGLTKPDAEASKDYQDLCRARMATKGQSGTTEGSGKGRITSLSKESEQSPSSRSSTSSWSEEPALNNMDISTGHMVLSYMEDHLKNKDRLDQEWVALCAYVAEPCETSVAMKKNNIEKTRYPEVVPYDHARVVLNELSNIAGCDYINASSITDHDPRNPAYIATQGPLPHTAPDFWQMIWEQGAVVIVMLTRLTEGGAAMCHRYWPEEGSEVYHIYEVHLVSEHIWCDDYLVRSFYLKNIRTGETRTVTQFHFLSWPEAGVPSSTKALLEFRRKVNKSYRGRSCPIVVHCSDGAGRTGTYCLIDMVLSRMAKGAKEIDIAATLEHLRDQRPKMVATKQQFEFVLTAVAEEVHAILKALPPQPTPPSAQEKSEK